MSRTDRTQALTTAVRHSARGALRGLRGLRGRAGSTAPSEAPTVVPVGSYRIPAPSAVAVGSYRVPAPEVSLPAPRPATESADRPVRH